MTVFELQINITNAIYANSVDICNVLRLFIYFILLLTDDEQSTKIKGLEGIARNQVIAMDDPKS